MIRNNLCVSPISESSVRVYWNGRCFNSVYAFVIIQAIVFQIYQIGSAAPTVTIEDLKAGVVKITATVNGKTRVGTGIIVNLEDDTAYIVTASHVIEGDSEPKVTFYADLNETFTAKVIGLEGGDPKGLAALRVKGISISGLRVLRMDENTAISGGERVTMIGFPRELGTPWAITRGVIAGQRGSDLTFSGTADEGNSGGPLLLEGNVVGIVTQTTGRFGYASPTVTTLYALKGWGIGFEEVAISSESTTSKSVPAQDMRLEPHDDPKGLPKEITSEDGAIMILVPKGKFTMGEEPGLLNLFSKENNSPEHLVNLDAYYIDKFEVTVKRFNRFLMQNEKSQPLEWDEFYLFIYTTWSDALEKYGNFPVINVTFQEASDYCYSVGKRLPTEAEWEKAARGTDGRKYPWGNEDPSSSHANSILANPHFYSAYEKSNSVSKYNFITPGGAFSGDKSPYGVYDMAGNVFEWVSDFYDPTYYERSPRWNPKGPLGEDPGWGRAVRGGSFALPSEWMETTKRGVSDPVFNIGFRCAKDAP